MVNKKPKLETKINNNIGVAAADFSPARAWITYPLSHIPETSSFALERIWRRARSLYANCPEIRHAVNTLAMMVGTLTPRPATGDEEWNKKAREVFLKRVNNSFLFDANSTLNFQQAQLWLERRAIVDGDCLTVLTTGKDGGGQVQFFSAPQITTSGDYSSGYSSGVVQDGNGKVKGYHVYDYKNKKPYFVASGRAILYRHSPDPATPRGASELIAAINTAQDIYEIIGFNKSSIKFASLFGLIETTEPAAKSTFSDLAALRNPARAANGGSTQNTAQNPAQPTLGVSVGGTQAITLSPGHSLTTLHDSRPSNEVQAFIQKLVNSIAYAVGIDPCVLFDTNSMGSASARFVIAKCKDIIKQRLQDRISWANKIYQYILSCEVKAGRLEPCPVEDWDAVKWISNSGWSIDLGRDANSAMSLISKGLMSADDYTLSTSGKTSEEIFSENLHAITHNIEKAKAAGVDYYMVAAPSAGSTFIPDKVETPAKTETQDDDGLVESK